MKKAILGGVLLVSSSAFAGYSSLPELNINQLHDQEIQREAKGEAPHFAVPTVVAITPEWNIVGNNLVWKHNIYAPNAVSLNFGFTKFKLSKNAKLEIYSSDLSKSLNILTAKDNNVNNELWTAVLMSESAIIELTVPMSEESQNLIELGSINQGFRTFTDSTKKSGSCNVDVACKESRGWENEVNSVAVISKGGSSFCTGFMVNNTANDKTPYFMTAAHCGVDAAGAKSLVTYWNYQASKCGGSRDGQHNQYQSGATFLAASRKTDFTLVKLNSNPQESFGVRFAGWDRTGADATSSTVIHHPNTDEKAISFENDPTEITAYGGDEVPGDGTHVKVVDYEIGTTEPGSSGSPLFDQNHRVIGQLHGGGAACGNDEPDWFGRFSLSWTGEGKVGTRLQDYLDSGKTGAQFVDTI
jgi:lysyl endopeptidase